MIKIFVATCPYCDRSLSLLNMAHEGWCARPPDYDAQLEASYPGAGRFTLALSLLLITLGLVIGLASAQRF